MTSAAGESHSRGRPPGAGSPSWRGFRPASSAESATCERPSVPVPPSAAPKTRPYRTSSQSKTPQLQVSRSQLEIRAPGPLPKARISKTTVGSMTQHPRSTRSTGAGLEFPQLWHLDPAWPFSNRPGSPSLRLRSGPRTTPTAASASVPTADPGFVPALLVGLMRLAPRRVHQRQVRSGHHPLAGFVATRTGCGSIPLGDRA